MYDHIMASDGSAASDFVEPYRFVSDLAALIEDGRYPGIKWNAEGTHFEIVRGVFDAPGGGMSLICNSKELGSCVRQLNYYGIFQDKTTHPGLYFHQHLFRGALPEQLALIQRERTGPAARAAAASGPQRNPRQRRAGARKYYDDDDGQDDDGDGEFVPSHRGRSRGGGGQSVAHGVPVTRHSGGRGALAVAAAVPPGHDHAADVTSLKAKLGALVSELAAARQALASTQVSLQLVTRLIHRQGEHVGWSFAQVPPGLPGVMAGIDLRASGSTPKAGDAFTFISEDALIAAATRTGAAAAAAACHGPAMAAVAGANAATAPSPPSVNLALPLASAGAAPAFPLRSDAPLARTHSLMMGGRAGSLIDGLLLAEAPSPPAPKALPPPPPPPLAAHLQQQQQRSYQQQLGDLMSPSMVGFLEGLPLPPGEVGAASDGLISMSRSGIEVDSR